MKIKDNFSNAWDFKLDIMNNDPPEQKSGIEDGDKEIEKPILKIEFDNYLSNFISEVQKSNRWAIEKIKSTKNIPQIFIPKSSKNISPKVRFNSIDETFKFQSSKNKSIKILDTENNI